MSSIALPRPLEHRRPLAGQTVFVLAVCLGVGLALRIWMAARSGLWRDEALFLFIVRLPTWAEMIDFLRLHESHPPLFYVLMRLWLGIAGTSEAAALTVPVLLGVALIPLAYVIGAAMFSRRAGLIAAALVTASPTLTLHSALARPYSLLPLLCLASVYFLWRALQEGRGRIWAAQGATTLALLLTHNWSWMVYAAEWVAVGAALLLPLPRRRGVLVREWLLVQATVLTAYAGWIPTLLYQTAHAGHGPAPVSSLAEGFLIFARTALFFPETQVGVETDETARAMALAGALLIGVLLAVAIGRTVRSGEANTRQSLALVLLIGVPLVSVAAATVLSARSFLLPPRCLTTVVPCLLLALAQGIASLSPKGNRLLSLSATAVLVALSLATGLAQAREIKSNARQVAEAVAARLQPTDLVVITPDWIASSFNYYFTPRNPQICFPHEGRLEATPFDDQRQRLRDPEAYRRVRARLEQARREGRRVWLIMDRDHVVDADHRLLEQDVLPETMIFPGFIGLIRSNQLRYHLTRLYGPPDTPLPPNNRIGDEIFVAFLFGDRTAPDATPQPGSTGGTSR